MADVNNISNHKPYINFCFALIQFTEVLHLPPKTKNKINFQAISSTNLLPSLHPKLSIGKVDTQDYDSRIANTEILKRTQEILLSA